MMNQNRFDNFAKAVSEGGFRMTAARRAIIDEFARLGGHLSADGLAQKVRAAHPSIGRMTVYRTLDLLNQLGLVRPVYQGTGAAHYILMDRGSHHHLVCDGCGLTIEFDECQGEELSRLLSVQFNFDIQSHLLEFHGSCQDCKTDSL